AKTQAALLEAMSEMQVTEDGITYDLPQPFFCIATQNPIGSAGTHPLPDSQLDRFMIRLSLGYPSLESTVKLVQIRSEVDPLTEVRAVASPADLLRMQQAVSDVFMEEELIRYAAVLCERTRDLPEIEQGLSTRAVLALVQMSKAMAYLSGRNYCVPKDIQNVFVDVCAHRILLTSRAKIRGARAEGILNDLLEEVRIPNAYDR
ncbi:MAG: MoxR family ATPase, partial [Clostridia bacterium]|nr:MoxR family ATPase [Clostridia bacterium]